MDIPYDGGYKEFYSFPIVVEGVVKDILPASIADLLDFSSMEPYPNNFIDEGLKEFRSDTLWKIKLKGTDQWAYLFLLILIRQIKLANFMLRT